MGGPALQGTASDCRGQRVGAAKISGLIQQEPEARHSGYDKPNGQKEYNVEPILAASPLFCVTFRRQWLAGMAIGGRHVDVASGEACANHRQGNDDRCCDEERAEGEPIHWLLEDP